MKLAPGTRLGVFEVVSPLGAGGMGEVWRARDMRLQRDVAIKVLPEALVGDPERRARFEREARLLASLSHPNIGALLALEEAGGVPALVLELVEGPTLAERLAQEGARPAAEAMAIAQAIAEAMEYAHELGIVHRDLKPANIKFTRDDMVKVLDFGLAKALAADEGGSVDASLTHSPTRTMGTQAGVLLGTAAYMAPEQARGKAVDRRADIWAFGVVVFEMLSGRQLFAGETLSDTIARILEREPDWSLLPASTPPRLVTLLQRCLVKDPRARLRDIGDARLELIAITNGEADPTARAAVAGPKAWWPFALVAVLALAAGLAGGLALRGARPESEVQRVSISLPEGVSIRAAMFTEGGRVLIARGAPTRGTGGPTMLYRRPLDAFEWSPIPGTEGVFSYDLGDDDQWLYMVVPSAPGSPHEKMVRVPVDGSAPPSDVCAWPEEYGAWDVMPDGRILVARIDHKSYMRVVRGQQSQEPWKPFESSVTLLDLTIESVLPDGRAALATAGYFGPSGWAVEAASIDIESGRVTTLVANASTPRLTASGYLLVGRGDKLLAAPFDLARRQVIGEPVALIEGMMVLDQWGGARAGVSPSGAILYRPGGTSPQHRRMGLHDREGRWSEWGPEQMNFQGDFAASSDGRRVVAVVLAPGSESYELFVFDRDRPSARRLVPSSPDDKMAPVLAGDGRRVAYAMGGTDSLEGVYVGDADGETPPRRLLASKHSSRIFHQPTGWLPDGNALLLESTQNQRTRITLLPATGGEATPTDLVTAPYNVTNGTLSSDGRTLAFLSQERGHPEPWVARFERGAVVGIPVPVLPQEVRALAWAPDRRRLWCVSPQFDVTAFDVGEDLRITKAGPAVSLRGEAVSQRSVRPLAGGGLLVVRRADGEAGPERFELVIGFDRELKRRLSLAGSKTR